MEGGRRVGGREDVGRWWVVAMSCQGDMVINECCQ